RLGHRRSRPRRPKCGRCSRCAGRRLVRRQNPDTQLIIIALSTRENASRRFLVAIASLPLMLRPFGGGFSTRNNTLSDALLSVARRAGANSLEVAVADRIRSYTKCLLVASNQGWAVPNGRRMWRLLHRGRDQPP